jgi:phosphatidylinositol dimannoside acyltransferase
MSDAPPLSLNAAPPVSRFGLHGDIIWRAMLHGVRSCPPYLEQPLIAGWATIVWLLAGPQRRGLMSNAAHLHPEYGVLRRALTAWRTFFEFGCVTTDSMRTQAGDQIIAWQVAGLTHFQTLVETPGPAILLTAHMGSYDAAASFFAQRMGRMFYAVRMPERNPHLQKIREDGLRRVENANYRTLYNSSESVLAVDLLRATNEGHLVALQGDRALPGLSVTPIAVPEVGAEWALPRGPFLLAIAARAQCLPTFVRRIGHRHYRVDFWPALGTPDVKSREDRDAAVSTLAHTWSSHLYRVLQRWPSQWLVFEPTFLKMPTHPAPADLIPPSGPLAAFPAPQPNVPRAERLALGTLVVGTFAVIGWQAFTTHPILQSLHAVLAAFIGPHVVMMSYGALFFTAWPKSHRGRDAAYFASLLLIFCLCARAAALSQNPVAHLVYALWLLLLLGYGARWLWQRRHSST